MNGFPNKLGRSPARPLLSARSKAGLNKYVAEPTCWQLGPDMLIGTRQMNLGCFLEQEEDVFTKKIIVL